MPTRTFLNRIGRAEESLKAQSLFSVDCICFPKKERPIFGFPIEMEIAGKVKCPLHGERFKPLFHLYVPKWLREKSREHLENLHSEQYRKAWFAGFTPDLWPAEEEESEEGRIFLKLKNGTRLLAYEPRRALHPERLVAGHRLQPVVYLQSEDRDDTQKGIGRRLAELGKAVLR